MEFTRQVIVAHRSLEAPDCVLDKQVKRPAIDGSQGNVGGFFIDALVRDGMHASAQRHHVGTRDDFVGKFRLRGLSEYDARSACVVDAELRLESRAR